MTQTIIEDSTRTVYVCYGCDKTLGALVLGMHTYVSMSGRRCRKCRNAVAVAECEGCGAAATHVDYETDTDAATPVCDSHPSCEQEGTAPESRLAHRL